MAQDKPNSTEQLQSELKALADTLDEVLNDSAGKSEQELKKLKEKAEKMLTNARSSLSQASEKLVKQTRAAADNANQFVHEKPWQGIGIATAVGVLVGLLVSCRRCK